MLLVMLTVVGLVLIMSVNPAFGGQSFIESEVNKILDPRRMCADKVRNWTNFLKFTMLMLPLLCRFMWRYRPLEILQPENHKLTFQLLLQMSTRWV